MTVLQSVLTLWLIAAVAQSLAWLWQLKTKNAGIVDVVWSAGVGLAAIWYAVVGSGSFAYRTTVGVLGALWAFRLTWYLASRVFTEPEDGRYAYLRQYWQGNQFYWFLFFQAQAGFIVLFGLPFMAVAHNPETAVPNLWWVLGVLVWMGSIAGELVADKQLANFRNNPANKGKTCRQGMWRYSRHPNYFFEWLHWFAYVCLAIGSPWFGFALAGPIVMYVFLRYLTGIPYTEAQALRTRGDDYRAYQQSTPMLFPWFPKDTPHD